MTQLRTVPLRTRRSMFTIRLHCHFKACFMLLRQLHAVATPSLLRRRGRFMVLRRVVLHRGAFHRQNARGWCGSRISLLVCFGSVCR